MDKVVELKKSLFSSTYTSGEFKALLRILRKHAKKITVASMFSLGVYYLIQRRKAHAFNLHLEGVEKQEALQNTATQLLRKEV